MPLYLHSRITEGQGYEVLSFDKAAHTATVRGVNGVMLDPNFHIEIVKRVFSLSEIPPECLKEK